jgi:hypothetical protein
VISNVLPVLELLTIVNHVKVTEKMYQNVSVQMVSMKPMKNNVHHVTTNVLLVLNKTITVLLVPKTESMLQDVTVLQELITLITKPLAQIVTKIVKPVLENQEIVLSVPEI